MATITESGNNTTGVTKQIAMEDGDIIYVQFENNHDWEQSVVWVASPGAGATMALAASIDVKETADALFFPHTQYPSIEETTASYEDKWMYYLRVSITGGGGVFRIHSKHPARIVE